MRLPDRVLRDTDPAIEVVDALGDFFAFLLVVVFVVLAVALAALVATTADLVVALTDLVAAVLARLAGRLETARDD